MKRYANLSGTSGVSAYEPGADFIRVEFKEGATYLYTYTSSGAGHVEEMKRLAAEGFGLGTYISKFVRDRYARKED